MNKLEGEDGGYDDGYKACSCFWGTQPASLLEWLVSQGVSLQGSAVIDVGCGEGKNAIYCARHGAHVLAIDISEVALSNARTSWPDFNLVTWKRDSVLNLRLANDSYDLVIGYGLLHCLRSRNEIDEAIGILRSCARPGGYNMLCMFNDRLQDLKEAHPGFAPTLLPHAYFCSKYEDWNILFATDQDLHETHPHNKVPHVHSMTRLVARK